MGDLGYKPVILEDLRTLRNLPGLKKLICTNLNYDYKDRELSPLPDGIQSQMAAPPSLLANGGSDGGFHIIYVQLASANLSITVERGIINKMLQEHPYAMFVFANKATDDWHFINVKHDIDVKRRKLFRRIRVSPHEQLRTAAERLSMIDLEQVARKFPTPTALLKNSNNN